MSNCATPWIAAYQAPLSFTISWSLLKLMSIELVMLSNHLIFCHPLLLLTSIFPSIRVFSNESALHIRGPKSWSSSFMRLPELPHLYSIAQHFWWRAPSSATELRWSPEGRRAPYRAHAQLTSADCHSESCSDCCFGFSECSLM